MRNFQDAFETRKRSFISVFSICITLPLKLRIPLRQHSITNFLVSFLVPVQQFWLVLEGTILIISNPSPRLGEEMDTIPKAVLFQRVNLHDKILLTLICLKNVKRKTFLYNFEFSIVCTLSEKR